MISIKRHLDDLGTQGVLVEELKDSYQAALEGMAHSLPSVSPELVAQCRQQILAALTEFEQQPTAEVLSKNRNKLKKDLRAFAEGADQILETKDQQFKEILRSFAEVAATLAKQSETNDGRLTGFTRNLDALVGLQDLSEIRKRLGKQVSELRQAVAEMREASQESVTQLRAELRQFQEKLAYSEEMARTDALTGLRNRGSGEQALRSAVAHHQAFSIVLLDLNGFKGINDRWGHPAGDVVLKKFAGRLEGAVRSMDMVCRWGGDEFLVLLPDCTLAQAGERSEEFRRACEGEYRVKVMDKPITLMLHTALGVAEWQFGDRIDKLLYRADEGLYRDKGKWFAA